MRMLLSGISVLLCGLLFMGAVHAPVMQSQSFYINDHAGVLSQENRDNMLESAQKLYDETGARVVLLTIENLDGRTPEEYAEAVYHTWELGVEGAALVLLFSTEKKRFAIYANTDITVADTDILLSDVPTSFNVLAAEGQVDIAANDCFMYIIYSINSMYLTNGEIITKSGDVTRVPTKSPVVSEEISKVPENTSITEVTQNTESTKSFKEKARTIFFALLFVTGFFMLSQTAKGSRKRNHNANYKNEAYDYRRIYSPDEPITARIDDLDYPSGFGGPGNRKAIYLEDVNDADDIGIIKRKCNDVLSGE